MVEHNSFSDHELINMLRNGNGAEQPKAFEIIYLKYKGHCTRFMKSKFGELEEIKDIYHNAVIVLSENAKKPGWQLTSKIQTFLISICYHQGLTELGRPKSSLGPEDDVEDITEGYLPMEESLNTERVRVALLILNDRTKTTKICYEIITRRLYRNQPYEIIFREMGYNNARTAITRYHKCIKNFKKEVLKILNGK